MYSTIFSFSYYININNKLWRRMTNILGGVLFLWGTKACLVNQVSYKAVEMIWTKLLYNTLTIRRGIHAHIRLRIFTFLFIQNIRYNINNRFLRCNVLIIKNSSLWSLIILFIFLYLLHLLFLVHLHNIFNVCL